MGRMLLMMALVGVTGDDLTSKAPADDRKLGDVLTTLGTHRFFDGGLTVDLTEERGKIQCRIKHELPEGMQGFGEEAIKPPFDKATKWFVYPQSDHEVWTFDGADFLILTIYNEDHPGSVSWNQAGAEGTAGRKLPEEVRKRLPREFLEKDGGADDKREEKPRFKGVELYSWKGEKDVWMFVLLNGTNRNKSEKEVKGAKGAIRGADDLKKAFARLAAGEHVFWVDRIEGFEFPPETTRKAIQKAAKEAEIELRIPEPKERQ